ncbi:MAG: hypothetical protein QMD14_05960, partial [Candidatus Aenigmarchaeota archaeon]|nr:hypothetical protein [Candidatus Aenigmarchaeota archaeon]
AKGYPDKMEVRIFCREEIIGKLPATCGTLCKTDADKNQFRSVELSVSDGSWWKCIAPGCEERYGITIRSSADC